MGCYISMRTHAVKCIFFRCGNCFLIPVKETQNESSRNIEECQSRCFGFNAKVSTLGVEHRGRITRAHTKPNHSNRAMATLCREGGEEISLKHLSTIVLSVSTMEVFPEGVLTPGAALLVRLWRGIRAYVVEGYNKLMKSAHESGVTPFALGLVTDFFDAVCSNTADQLEAVLREECLRCGADPVFFERVSDMVRTLEIERGRLYALSVLHADADSTEHFQFFNVDVPSEWRSFVYTTVEADVLRRVCNLEHDWCLKGHSHDWCEVTLQHLHALSLS